MKTIKRVLFYAACGVGSTLLRHRRRRWREEADVAAAPEAAEPVDHLSGNLIMNIDTNFMSYGYDVWQTGTSRRLFHPQFDLKWDFGNGFNAYRRHLVGREQQRRLEHLRRDAGIDVWLGAGYTYEKFSVSLAYQEWMYGATPSGSSTSASPTTRS